MGNYLGDLVKGREVSTLPPEIQRGVEMHRAIDRLTDSDSDVKELNRLIASRHGRYASVLTDIGFDFFLYRNWREFGPVAFPEFCSATYQCILRQRPLMSEKVAGYATNMAKGRWLDLYTTQRGMNEVLERLKKRLSKPELLEGVEDLLIDFEEEFNQTFLLLFPRLQTLADGYRP